MLKLLNKVKAWFSSFRNRYEGAVWNPKRSVIPGALTSARFDCSAHSRQEIARKARYFERNSALVQALAGKFENFVVGANPQMIPSSSDPAWNIRAKEWLDEWATKCDIASRQSFGTILNLLARSWFIDGDVFILLTKGEELQSGSRVMQFPRLQVIEGHLCKTPKDFEKDPMVIDGVRVDERGRPIGYYFATEKKQGEFEFTFQDAENVIHLFEPSRPGQQRGISFLHSCINELHDVDDLMILEMQAARENATVTTWIETENGEIDPAEAIRQRYTRSQETNTGGTATVERSTYYEAISGGRAKLLKRGDKVSQNPGLRPSVTTVQYWKLKLEMICAGVEIPYCIVFPDSMQGTVYRGALDMATSFFRSRHAVLAEVQRRIYAYVMRFATAIDRQLANRPGDYLKVSIMPPRAPNVDVGRNASAEKEALMDGRTNYDLIYGPLGLDWRDELKKLDSQLAYIDAECPALAKHLQSLKGPTTDGPVQIKQPEDSIDV